MKIKQYWYFLFAIVIVAAFLFIKLCGNPLDILGPRDKPDIASEKWDSLRVTYWVYTADPDKEIRREFTIKAPSDIALLRSHLTTEKTSGLSIGTGNQLEFWTSNEEIWHGDFCFEDTLHLSMTTDAWRSYRFVLSDLGFYNELRKLCAGNERNYYRDATPEHVNLRRNLVSDYPKLKRKL